ncbi:MAG: hypothetical protein F6K40_21765 [Okeania sp. SIO3I5]|uniref:hypothetical protein n=1 Tax=Okeania sp. SIO3I5 TaxID=2607805 RepID=UPI0013BC92F1|nr:hypothetical protein [Okeania sp. SIO3I5]NEQ38753.1 hypothetical protein [Okeania sp. SIO3I5]
MIIVSDTSPLYNLQLVNSLWLLRELYTSELLLYPASEVLTIESSDRSSSSYSFSHSLMDN